MLTKKFFSTRDGLLLIVLLAFKFPALPAQIQWHQFVENRRPVAVHCTDFKPLEASNLMVTPATGEVVANDRPGQGKVTVEITMRLLNPGATDAGFNFAGNLIGLDGKQHDYFLNGPLFGKSVISLGRQAEKIASGEFFTLIIKKTDSLVVICVDNAEIYRSDRQVVTEGKMGIRPGKAEIEVESFKAEGDLIPVSLQPPWFTVPLIDLAFDEYLQVVIDQEKNQYLGHPSSVLTADGKTIFLAWPKGHGSGEIVMKKSLDGGYSWSQRMVVPDSWASSQEVPTLFSMMTPQKRERLIMFSGLYPIRMSYSDDKGLSWSPLQKVFDFGGIVAMGDMVRLNNGDYMVFFHDDGRFIVNEKKTDQYFVYSSTSSDGGLTWSFPQIVASHPFYQLCEPGVVRSPDGRELALLLRENSRSYNSLIIFSNNEGKSWSTPIELPSSLTGDRHQAQYARDGRLIIVFRDMARQSPTKGDFVAWVGRWDDLKQGKEGQYRIRLLNNLTAWDCGYPAFEILPDGSFFAATYGKWEKYASHFIKGLHFTMAMLDQKSLELPEFTDVYVNGAEGYAAYRIPALLYTSEKTLLAFAEGRSNLSDHAENDIVCKRSLDGGNTWLPLQILAEDGQNSLNNPLVVEVQPGNRILLMYQRYPFGFHEAEVGPGYDADTICRAFMMWSEDEGFTWSVPEEITSQIKRPTWATSIAGGPGNGIQLKNGKYKGRILMPFNQGPAGKWKVYGVYSDDLGKSWSYGEVAFEKDSGYGNEVQMVELSDGRIMLNSRSQGAQKFRKTAVSADGGENWTGLEDDLDLIEPECMATIIRMENTGYERAPILFANPASQTNRIFGTISLSFDDASTWMVSKCIYNGAFAYSSLADMDQGNFGLLFERDGYAKISFMKSHLDWLIPREKAKMARK